MVIGDLNLHSGNVHVKDNHEKITLGGRLLNDLINGGDYVIVNSTEKSVNGPFTRYDVSDPDNSDKKSLLDYVIVSSSLISLMLTRK